MNQRMASLRHNLEGKGIGIVGGQGFQFMTDQMANFMASQIAYLRGVDCGSAEVHFVCTERYNADWAALLSSFGIEGAQRGARWASSRKLARRTCRQRDSRDTWQRARWLP